MKLIRLEETEQSLKTMSLAGEDGSSHQKESKFPFRVVTSKSSLDKFLSPPITPMKARAVKSFPIGKEWIYEPKWDGFRCLVFRDEESIFLQSRTGKNLTSAFPEIVAAFRALSPKRFVLDGELALPTEDGFSFDGLVNRLRIGSARLALEVMDSPAIYIVFDMLASSENLLGSPFRVRRRTLERFFENFVPRSSPLYLSASTEDLREVEKWVGHIGQQLDGIIAKRSDAPYRPGDDHSTVKIKNYRSADCVVAGFRDHIIGSARNELLLGLYDQKGHLQYVSSVGIDAKQSGISPSQCSHLCLTRHEEEPVFFQVEVACVGDRINVSVAYLGGPVFFSVHLFFNLSRLRLLKAAGRKVQLIIGVNRNIPKLFTKVDRRPSMMVTSPSPNSSFSAS